MAQNPWDKDPVVRDRRLDERERAETRYRNSTGDANPLAQPVILPGEVGYAGPGQFLPDAGVVVRRQPWEADPVISESELAERAAVQAIGQAGLLNIPGMNAFTRGAIEQAPGGDEALAGIAALGTGSTYSEARRRQGMIADYDRENSGMERNLGGVAGFAAGLAAPGSRFVEGLPVAAGATQTAIRAAQGAKVGRAAAVSGAYGAAYGGGQGEGGVAERLPGAAIGLVTGAAGGAALQRGSQVVGTYAQRLTSIASPSAASPVAARVADFDRVGVDPMLAGVGGPLTQRTAQTLAGNVLTGGPMASASARVREQTVGAVDDIASRYGAAEGRGSAGAVLRRGAQEGADRLRQEGGSLYAPINALEANPTPIALTNAQGAITESLSTFTTPELRNWFARKATDLTDFENLLQRTGGTSSFAEARRLRSIVGQMLDDPEVFRSQSQAGLNRLYGALSDDIREGARLIGGDEAATALSRADRYYSAARGRADEVLRQFYGAQTDAEAYNRLVQRAATKGNRSSWQQIRQLRDSVTSEEWGDIGAGVIRTLGDKGDGFSVAQFATEWEKITPQARRILFGGSERAEVFQDLNALARVVRTQSGAARFYNYSESGNVAGNLAGASALGGASVAAMSGNAVPLVAVLGAGALGNGLSRILTSPRVARWAAGPASRAVPDGDRLARANPAFAEFWNANREAVIRLVAQNDNLAGQPATAAAEQE